MLGLKVFFASETDFRCFGGIGAPILFFGNHFDTFGHPGRPREQQEAHVGIQGRIFSDLGMILGTVFQSCSGTDGLKPRVVFGFVSIALSTSSISKSKSGALEIMFSS